MRFWMYNFKARKGTFSLKETRFLVDLCLREAEVRSLNYLDGYRMQIKCEGCGDKVHSVFSNETTKCLCGLISIMENKFHYRTKGTCISKESIVHFKKLRRH